VIGVRPSVAALKEVYNLVVVERYPVSALTLAFKIAIHQLLGAFPIIIPPAFSLQPVDVLWGRAILAAGKRFYGVG
jgi:hypothetical protein